MGRQGFNGELVGLMLATGWVAIFSMVEEDRIWSEVWNPFQVYPEFGYDGMVEVSNIYPMTPSVANRKVKVMEWTVKNLFTHNVNLYNYWGFDDDGDVVNGIVLGEEGVKPLIKEPALSKLGILPVFTSPVGGLPDRGAITGGKWQEHFGESIIAVPAELSKNYNKMLSFTQQAVRNAAQPRWFEKSSGETPILTEENLEKWGGIFRMGPNDNIGALQPPTIPVELRTIMFEYQNMLQRTLFPWVMFGNLQQQISYLAIANVASSALQILTPYMDAFRGIKSDIDNYWIRMIIENGYRPNGFELPDNLPEKFEFDVQADIEIPGYLVQRATISRMLNPAFRLPTPMIMDKLFPEIKNPLRAMAGVRREDAMMHPKAVMADAIIAYKEKARELRDANLGESATLYEKVAASLEVELVGTPAQQVRARPPSEVTVPREVMPEEATTPLEGLGGI